ncbi:MAG: hypothetical protein AAF235_03410 [Planctomycetota bacterium]
MDAVSLLLAAFVRPGRGLIAVYLTLVNAVAHLAAAARFRVPKPGLWTSIGPSVPAGIGGLLAINHAGEGDLAMHGVGLGAALAIHIASVVKALAARRDQ